MDDLRVGAEEREVAVAALGAHMTAGRLTAGEFAQRAGAASAALVRGDLRPLFADLPPPHPPFLGAAALPDELRAALAAEGTLVLAADVPGEISYRRYRVPGTSIRRRTDAVTGTVAVTGRRLLVWAGGAKRVDVPFDHPLRAAVAVTAGPPGLLRCAFDVGAFHPDRSGRVEIRLRTSRAADVVRLSTGGHPGRGDVVP